MVLIVLRDSSTAVWLHNSTNNNSTRTCLLWRSRFWRHPPTRQLSRYSEWACRSRTARCPEGTKAGELCPWRPRNGFLKYTRKVRRLWDKDIIIKMTLNMKHCRLSAHPRHALSVCAFFSSTGSIYFYLPDFKGQMYHLVYKISAQQKIYAVLSIIQ